MPALTEHLANELRECEELLLRPDGRTTGQLARLLHDDFHEHGLSGCVYCKQDVLDAVDDLPDIELPVEGMDVCAIGSGTVLITYESITRHEDGTRSRARRSSYWVHTPFGWRLVYHQGVPAH